MNGIHDLMDFIVIEFFILRVAPFLIPFKRPVEQF